MQIPMSCRLIQLIAFRNERGHDNVQLSTKRYLKPIHATKQIQNAIWKRKIFGFYLNIFCFGKIRNQDSIRSNWNGYKQIHSSSIFLMTLSFSFWLLHSADFLLSHEFTLSYPQTYWKNVKISEKQKREKMQKSVWIENYSSICMNMKMHQVLLSLFFFRVVLQFASASFDHVWACNSKK